MKKWLSLTLVIVVLVIVAIITQIEIRRMMKKNRNATERNAMERNANAGSDAEPPANEFIISYDEVDKELDLGQNRKVIITRTPMRGDTMRGDPALKERYVQYHPSILLKANMGKLRALKGIMQTSPLSGVMALIDVYKSSTSMPSLDVNYHVYSNYDLIAIECADFMLIKFIDKS